MQRIILASGSKQRKNLLESLDLEFEIIPANIDEKAIRDDDLKIRAEKIARSKAEKIAPDHDGIIISADTFGGSENEVFEKPKDIEEAKIMLRNLSEKKLNCYTGFCYIDKKNSIDFSITVVTEMVFRKIDEDEINTYIEMFPVTTWAAAVSPAYLYGMTLFKEINGSLTGFSHGLPMEVLIPLLRKSGIQINPAVPSF